MGMSQENVEAFKRGIEAFNRRDIEAMLDEQSSDVEWHPILQVLLGGEAAVYRGHEGIRAVNEDLHSAFAGIRIEIEEIRNRADVVVGLGRVFGRSKQGLSMDEEYGLVVRFRDGRGVWGRDWYSHAEALDAAGLRE